MYYGNHSIEQEEEKILEKIKLRTNSLLKYYKVYFSFLEEMGYLKMESTETLVIYKKDIIEVHIILDLIGYEISCQFVNNEQCHFTLQDLLNYRKITKYKGQYQFKESSQISLGLKYIANVTHQMLKEFDISDDEFINIYKYCINTRDESLSQYYRNLDIKKADEFWHEKKYKEAKLLYEKYNDYLTEIQMSRLDYVNKRL